MGYSSRRVHYLVERPALGDVKMVAMIKVVLKR